MLVSVIVPTYNEADNVESLALRVGQAFGDAPYELIFVDDSIDATPHVLARLAQSDRHVRFEHRGARGGLGSAVVRGFQLARGDVLAVMDGDLQHPPDLLPHLVAAIREGVDLAIASRFVTGGNDGGLDPARKLVSATARYSARFLLRAVRGVKDPTSGFFALRRDVIAGTRIAPSSWKVLVEILVRGRVRTFREVPFTFAPRTAGLSKLSRTEMVAYAFHLGRLVASSPADRRFAIFAAVGALCFVLNMVTYATLVDLGTLVTVAGLLSAIVATACNFVLNDRITWREVRAGPLWERSAKFGAISGGGIILNVAVLALLFRGAHINYLLANLIGIAASVAMRFYLNKTWTWRPHSTIDPTVGDERESLSESLSMPGARCAGRSEADAKSGFASSTHAG